MCALSIKPLLGELCAAISLFVLAVGFALLLLVSRGFGHLCDLQGVTLQSDLGERISNCSLTLFLLLVTWKLVDATTGFCTRGLKGKAVGAALPNSTLSTTPGSAEMS
jgi:hypothetical protein